MYGPWLAAILGGIGFVMLVIALLFTFTTPIFAIGLAALLIAGALVVFAGGREERAVEVEGKRSEHRGGKPSWMRKHWWQ